MTGVMEEWLPLGCDLVGFDGGLTFFFRSERNKKKEIQRVLGIYLYIAFELSKCDDALYIGIAWLTYKLHE